MTLRARKAQSATTRSPRTHCGRRPHARGCTPRPTRAHGRTVRARVLACRRTSCRSAAPSSPPARPPSVRSAPFLPSLAASPVQHRAPSRAPLSAPASSPSRILQPLYNVCNIRYVNSTVKRCDESRQHLPFIFVTAHRRAKHGSPSKPPCEIPHARGVLQSALKSFAYERSSIHEER